MENKINEINVKTQRLSHRKPPTQSLRYYVDVKTTRLGTSNKKNPLFEGTIHSFIN